VRRVVVGTRVVDGEPEGLVVVGWIGVCGGATTVFCCELLTITSPAIKPSTMSTAVPASTQSHRRGFGSSGFGGPGGSPTGRFGGP
jgi:hypothetical protein